MQLGVGIKISIPRWLVRAGPPGAGGSSYDPASEAIFASFTTPPTTQRKAAIDTCVVALKAAGVWLKLDALYLMAAADSQAARINWYNPTGAFTLVEVNAPAFTADRGYTGAGAKYLNTNWNPTTAPFPNFVQDSAALFVWSLTATAITGAAVGAAAGNRIYPKSAFNNSLVWLVNGAGGNTAIADGLGLSVASRTGPTTAVGYRNGTQVATNATASSAIASSPFKFGISDIGEYYAGGLMAGGGMGSGLTAADVTALYNALNTYMIAVGAVVSYQAETEAIAAAFTTPPTTARKARIDEAVVALKAGGVWAKLDTLYAFAAADSQAAKVNWVAPGTYNASEVAAPAFAADRGFTGAAASYLDSGFNPSTAPTPKYLNASASAFGWSLTAGQLTAGVVGLVTGNMLIVRPRGTSDLAQYVINRNSGFTVDWANTDGLGSYIATRTGNPANAIYKNGINMGAGGGSPTGVPTENIVFLTRQAAYWLGQIAAGGIGGALTDPEALALHEALLAYLAGIATDTIAASFTTPPTAGRKSLIQTCVGALMRAGVWAKLDTLYAFAAADSQAAKINWIAPGTYNATESGAPVFTADRGFTGAPAKYLDSGFNATTAPTPKFVRDSATIFAWGDKAGPAVTEVTFGSAAASTDSYLYPRYSGDLFYYGLNTATNTGPTSTDGSGLFSAVRTDASAGQGYRNGATIGSASTAPSTAPFNGNHRFMSRNGTNTYSGTISWGGFGSQLNAAENLALYNALRAYATGVGIP